MGLFGSLKKDAEEAASKVSAQFPGSSVSAHVDGDTVTLTGSAPDVETKRQIMAAFNLLVPKADNVINSIHPERPGSAAAAPAPAAHEPAAGGRPLEGLAPPVAGAAGQERVHVVESGDTLSAIAKKYYGHANQYMRIFEANRDILKDPDKIYPGQKLKIPG